MQLIIKRLSLSNKGIRVALIGTFIMNLTCTTIMLMFAFGLSNIRNESLSKDDLAQLMAIISSIISVAVLCIIFLQLIISIELKALFRSRREFNINMRLMGITVKGLGKIYFVELLKMQVVVIPMGIILTYVFNLILSATIASPNIGIDKYIYALLLHMCCILLSISLVIRKLVKSEVTEMIRGDKETTKYMVDTKSVAIQVIGIVILLITISLDKVLNYSGMEILYIISILVLSSDFFYYMSKMVIRASDHVGIPIIAFTERIQLGQYKKIKNMIMMLGIGLMLFLGLQSMFMSSRHITRQIGEKNIHYKAVMSFDELIENEIEENGIDHASSLNYVFYTQNSTYPKKLHGIGSDYLEYETINIDKTLSRVELEESLDDPKWKGIILPNSMISQDSIGEEITLMINDKVIKFIIEGGYYQNVFDESIWFANKAYIQESLQQANMVNVIYLKDIQEGYSETMYNLGAGNIELQEQIILKSVNKVVQSTEIIEITSLIVIICAVISIVSYLVLGSEANIIDISKLRSSGMSLSMVVRIYMTNILLIVCKGFALGTILSMLFAKIGLESMFANENIAMEVQYPYLYGVLLFVIIASVLLVTLFTTVRDSLRTDFTMILRRNSI